jgi:hypothetical protein
VAGGAGKDADVVRRLAFTGSTILRVRSFKELVGQRVQADGTNATCSAGGRHAAEAA